MIGPQARWPCRLGIFLSRTTHCFGQASYFSDHHPMHMPGVLKAVACEDLLQEAHRALL